MNANQQQIDGYTERVRQAYDNKIPLHIRGGGSKLFFTGQNPEAEVFDCSGYNGIVSYEPSELVITVRAGTTLRAVESMLASKGQQFPFEPPAYSMATTIGGMVASGFSGSRRPFSGAVRDAVLGIKLLNGKGEVLQFGGQVIKNVAGYDISRLVTGSFGTLGIILEASIKVVPRPPTEQTFSIEVAPGKIFSELRRLRSASNNLSGLACDGERVFYRLAGSEKSVKQIAAKLGGEEQVETQAFWKALNKQQLPFFNEDQPIWRISLPPAAPELDFGGDAVLDWAGALRWVKSSKSAEEIQSMAGAVGGHAMLFRSPEKKSMSLDLPSPTAERIHQRIKHSLDPHSIFNPGYLFPEAS
ncbi:MAG: glycolate oxidase subunit GlcE [Gammaproteobacteria bacterium]|nr:glycolate oxidase subunit GlcE [Gammaproteobacteria bacterium]